MIWMSQKRLYVLVGSAPSSPAQIAQMEVEIPSMPVSIRPTFQTRLAQSKSEVEKVKKSVVSCK